MAISGFQSIVYHKISTFGHQTGIVVRQTPPKIKKIGSESHEYLKIHKFGPIGLKFCVQEFFWNWLSSRWFLEAYEHDLRDFYFEGEI